MFLDTLKTLKTRDAFSHPGKFSTTLEGTTLFEHVQDLSITNQSNNSCALCSMAREIPDLRRRGRLLNVHPAARGRKRYVSAAGMPGLRQGALPRTVCSDIEKWDERVAIHLNSDFEVDKQYLSLASQH